jgi:YHS domain-containing protein
MRPLPVPSQSVSAFTLSTSRISSDGGKPLDRPNGRVKNVSLIPIFGVSDGRPTETEGTSEMKKYLLASVLLVGFAGSAYAVTGQFDNMCSWGLANHKDVPTDCSVNATIKGSTYCFSSQDAKTNFMKNPDANLKKAETFYKSEHKG